ncbi:MAG: hypothetical protein LN569_00420 [Rickettsia endosymbiont of Labidopullus appendiculatus]|nr:hypothetical protein [Rickettsia endosymbiont of Labidopullus appendiculatus]
MGKALPSLRANVCERGNPEKISNITKIMRTAISGSKKSVIFIYIVDSIEEL